MNEIQRKLYEMKMAENSYALLRAIRLMQIGQFLILISIWIKLFLC